MTGSLSHYPFLLALAAALLMGFSAILVRRVGTSFGGWLLLPSGLMSLFAGLGLGWSFYWALRQEAASAQNRAWFTAALGWVLLRVGVGLVLWSAAILGKRTFFPSPRARLEKRPPYRHLRRPMGLGVTLLGFGAALTLGTRSLWVWSLSWLLLSQPLFELEEWELRARLKGAGEYLRTTPRYLPRRGKHPRRGRG